MDKETIYSTATIKWGRAAQLLVVLEELAELQKAICKYMNRGGDIDDLFEETADVEIMCEQLRNIFKEEGSHPSFAHTVDFFKDFKLRRLAKKLKLNIKDGEVIK